jgi:hypothetical protein
MSDLPRRCCPVCGASVPVRRNGTLREHNIVNPKQRRARLWETSKCKGSGVLFGEAPSAPIEGGDDEVSS